jgi:hypothetical protein
MTTWSPLLGPVSVLCDLETYLFSVSQQGVNRTSSFGSSFLASLSDYLESHLLGTSMFGGTAWEALKPLPLLNDTISLSPGFSYALFFLFILLFVLFLECFQIQKVLKSEFLSHSRNGLSQNVVGYNACLLPDTGRLLFHIQLVVC